jgi:hypothetical protein
MGAFPGRPACLECRINRPAVRIRGGDRSVYACSRLDEKIGWMKTPNRAHLVWTQELRPVLAAHGMDAAAWTRLVEWFNFDCET